MKKENGICGKKRLFHRWIAWFMAAILVMGECNFSVLAEEGTLRAEESEEGASGEGLSAEDVDEDSTADGDKSNDADGAGNVTDGDGLPDKGNGEENSCVCDSRCSEDSVNEDCPVCAESYVNCIGQENGEIEEGDGSMEGELPEGNVPETPGLPELAGGGNKWCSGGRQYG